MLYKVHHDKGYYTTCDYDKAFEMFNSLNGFLICSKSLDVFPVYDVVCEGYRPSNYIYFIVKVRRRNKRKNKYL